MTRPVPFQRTDQHGLMIDDFDGGGCFESSADIRNCHGGNKMERVSGGCLSFHVPTGLLARLGKDTRLARVIDCREQVIQDPVMHHQILLPPAPRHVDKKGPHQTVAHRRIVLIARGDLEYILQLPRCVPLDKISNTGPFSASNADIDILKQIRRGEEFLKLLVLVFTPLAAGPAFIKRLFVRGIQNGATDHGRDESGLAAQAIGNLLNHLDIGKCRFHVARGQIRQGVVGEYLRQVAQESEVRQPPLESPAIHVKSLARTLSRAAEFVHFRIKLLKVAQYTLGPLR